jgi:sulfatase modifying factor 1
MSSLVTQQAPAAARESPRKEKSTAVVSGRATLASLSAGGLIALALLLTAPPAEAVEIDWVPVLDPGNFCDSDNPGGRCPGAVEQAYEISTFEITTLEYTEFLNAVAVSDPNALYDENMSILRTGSPGSYMYGSQNDDLPITYVSLYDSLRFANWLHNGKPSGDQDETTTEDGAYTLLGTNPASVIRNPTARVFLPSEDEWYKAAYWNPEAVTGYYDYPTGSNTETVCVFPPVATPNRANCDHSQEVLVGLYTGSPSPSGTFDQGGNLWERVEGAQATSGLMRGGAWNDGGSQNLAASVWSFVPNTTQLDWVGFRVARRQADPWVTITDPENAGDAAHLDFGAVDYVYQIGRYEVTNGEYAEFLNAVAASDPNELYDAGTDIARSGNSGSYTYAPIPDAESEPVIFVTFFDAARFANWLHNGMPTGSQNATTTEDGAYTLMGHGPLDVTRNPGARVFVPSEDEWYKAAYYDPALGGGLGGYYEYPAGSDAPIACADPSSASNQANCSSAFVVSVGSYTGSPSPWGTFDQGGNVFEWADQCQGVGCSLGRILRGGDKGAGASFTSAASRVGGSTTTPAGNTYGFRVARLPEPWVTVGDPGNVCDSQFDGCFGAVASVYQIGAFEVTNAEYAEFLNAVAASDPNALYNTFMDITRSGSSGSYTYTVDSPHEPVNPVTFFAALRMANWLHNGKPGGAQDAMTTEDGAYTLLGQNPTNVTRNPGARVFLPSEDEWYKAAYYDPLLEVGRGGYYEYPTSSNTQTVCAPPNSTPNQANCAGSGIAAAIGGLYTGSPSPWGTFDQGGNVSEWNEGTGAADTRILRGGLFGSSSVVLGADHRFGLDPSESGGGFRLARVPEPDAWLLGVTALLVVAGLRWVRA